MFSINDQILPNIFCILAEIHVKKESKHHEKFEHRKMESWEHCNETNADKIE